MPELINSIVSASEVAGFYKYYPGFWFLLEVLEVEKRKASKMRVVRYDVSKEKLREYLMDELADHGSKYIFVYADPDGKCEI